MICLPEVEKSGSGKVTWTFNTAVRSVTPTLCSAKFKFRPGYFLLQSSDCMLETCMLLAGMRVHEHR